MRGIISISIKYDALPPNNKRTLWWPIHLKEHRLSTLHDDVFQVDISFIFSKKK